jgi:hypothetical protein
MYKLFKDPIKNQNAGVILDGHTSIPFSTDNTDYANFKKDLANGAELQDEDGNTMTVEEVTQFIATLP